MTSEIILKFSLNDFSKDTFVNDLIMMFEQGCILVGLFLSYFNTLLPIRGMYDTLYIYYR